MQDPSPGESSLAPDRRSRLTRRLDKLKSQLRIPASRDIPGLPDQGKQPVGLLQMLPEPPCLLNHAGWETPGPGSAETLVRFHCVEWKEPTRADPVLHTGGPAARATPG